MDIIKEIEEMIGINIEVVEEMIGIHIEIIEEMIGIHIEVMIEMIEIHIEVIEEMMVEEELEIMKINIKEKYKNHLKKKKMIPLYFHQYFQIDN